MACSSGPRIVTSGLILEVDAANRKSNIRVTNNMIDNSGWAVGYSQTGGWPANGDAAQNEILYDTDPWGNSSLVLKTHPNNAGANGGWEGIAPGYWVNINPSKKYRSCVWVRRTSTATNGTFYYGLHTNGTGDVIMSNGSIEGNPYWACQNIGYLTQNQWYLCVGHIFPYNSTPAVDPTSGYWTNTNGMTYIGNPGCNIVGSDPRFPSDATVLRQRTYHYYANDAASNIELFNPRIDLCDGNEPSVYAILNTGQSQFKDISANSNNGVIVNNAQFASNNGGAIATNGSAYAINIPLNMSTTNCTIFGVSRYTNASAGGRIISGLNNNWLLGGFGGHTECFYAEGWVSGSVDGAVDNNWRIYTAVCNYTGDSWTEYVNGVITAGPNSSGSQGPNGFAIGEYGPGGTEFSVGQLALLLVYNRVLSDSEIKQNYQALRQRFGL